MRVIPSHLPTFALVFLAGIAPACGSSTAPEGAPSTSGAPDGGTPEAGGALEAGAVATCDDSIDLATDPANCGRCGRACDDGVCKAGRCAPRVEVAVSHCDTDFEVHGGELYVAIGATLVRAKNGVTTPIDDFTLPTVDTFRGISQNKRLVSDGETLVVYHLSDKTINARAFLTRFDAQGVRGRSVELTRGHLVSFNVAGGRVVTQSVGSEISEYDDAGQETFHGVVGEATPSGARFPTGVQLVGKDLFVGAGLAIHRITSGAPVKLFPINGASPWQAGVDGVDALDVGNPLLMHYELGTGELTILATLDASEGLKLLGPSATLRSGDTPMNLDSSDGSLVREGDTRYFFAKTGDVDGHGTRVPKTMLMEWSPKGGFKIVSEDVSSVEPMPRIRAGRLYWLDRCTDGVTTIRSLPL